MIGLVLRLPKFMSIMVFLLPLFLVISVLDKRLAGKSVSDVTYIVSSGTLNLNAINFTLNLPKHYIDVAKFVWLGKTLKAWYGMI